ncbi:MAG: A24 family peptidase [Anaerolineae bacterium]|nr:MAG: A24 family peptidase [Anaerolineae bacterium]
MTWAISIGFAVIGLLVGSLLNVLADDLPARVRPQRPHCPRCGYRYLPSSWLGLSRRFQGGMCPQCGYQTRRRELYLEVGTGVIFAALPWLIQPAVDLVIYSIYSAILILIIVIDLEHRLILHAVTIPVTAFALVASIPLTDNNPSLALTGAVAGFVFFFIAYLIGNKLFGAGALGFGDVTLSMTMGAMLGLQRILFTLVLGIVLAGIWGLIAIVSGRLNRRSYFPYGPFLAVAGLMAIIWGNRVADWFMNQ